MLPHRLVEQQEWDKYFTGFLLICNQYTGAKYNQLKKQKNMQVSKTDSHDNLTHQTHCCRFLAKLLYHVNFKYHTTSYSEILILTENFKYFMKVVHR